MSVSLEGHIVQRYDGELNALHVLLVEMGGLVLDQAQTALRTVVVDDQEAAQRVVRREEEVDGLEMRADDDIAWVIARRNPVARDLRALMCFSKVIATLERAGDTAYRVAAAASHLSPAYREKLDPALMDEIRALGERTAGWLQEALVAFDTLDQAGAERLIERGGGLDADFRSLLERLAERSPAGMPASDTINATLVVRALKRIGDHALSLAEYVVLLVSGRDMRHSGPASSLAD